MRFKRFRLVCVLALIALLSSVLLACGGQPEQKPAPKPAAPAAPADPRFGGSLKISVMANPPTLDPFQTTASLSLEIAMHMFETLFTMDKEYKPIPFLVDTWNMSSDGKVYTFNLRKNVPFHNGKEMQAEDVVASLNRWGAKTSWGKSLYAVLDKLEAKDKYTVVMSLKEPVAITTLYLTNTQAAIMPKEILQEAGDAEIKKFVGTGPFKFGEFVPDRHVRLDRFDKYASRTEEPNGMGGRRTAFVDSLFYIPVPDAAVRLAGAKTGEYHFSQWITQDEYARLKTDKSVVSLVTRPGGWLTAVFNKKSGPMSNVKIRQAYLAALDMEQVMKACYGDPDFWRLDPGIMMKEQAMWTDAGKEFYNQKNINRAKQLLQEAGYKGQPIRYMTTKEYPAYYTAALVSQPMLEAAGFKIELIVVDWATLVQRRSNPDLWDVYGTAFGISWDPVLQLALSPEFPGWYDSKEMQGYLAELRRESDFNKRMEVWKKAQALFYRDVPVIKFGDYFNLFVHVPQLKGYQNTVNRFFWNVYLEKK